MTPRVTEHRATGPCPHPADPKRKVGVKASRRTRTLRVRTRPAGCQETACAPCPRNTGCTAGWTGRSPVGSPDTGCTTWGTGRGSEAAPGASPSLQTHVPQPTDTQTARTRRLTARRPARVDHVRRPQTRADQTDTQTTLCADTHADTHAGHAPAHTPQCTWIKDPCAPHGAPTYVCPHVQRSTWV